MVLNLKLETCQHLHNANTTWWFPVVVDEGSSRDKIENMKIVTTGVPALCASQLAASRTVIVHQVVLLLWLMREPLTSACDTAA